ncbi:MAG: aminotransferase class I/II-fold pyridoxal phosphate-dependent enzyme [Acidobacteria bacterium]|nr:MAG: aminotransferase class I/II-fold pyridoxal phosphate-dependent enzyme [Acidobacteriota bacterium]
MAVPFIDLQRFEPGFVERWLNLCREITAGTQFVGGPRVAAFEERLTAELEVGGAVGCANGTDALQLALRAAGVGEGDRVLIPDATFWATFEAVVNCGARPVTVDVDPGDWQMDFELFRQAVERFRPRAAILVHLYGWGSARLDDFRTFCRRRHLPLIEDGAQAFGCRWRGESIYRGAELATISFYPAKVLGSCGDAGAVVGRDAAVLERVRRLGNHGRTLHYEHGLVGWNSRMAGLDAAYLSLSLDYLGPRLAARRRFAARYRQRLAELGVATAAPPPGYEENGYVNVTLIPPEERPAWRRVLDGHGVGYGTIYPGSMSEQPAAEGFLAGRLGGDQARRLARSVLNLPLFAGMRDDEFEAVMAAVEEAAGRGRRRPPGDGAFS